MKERRCKSRFSETERARGGEDVAKVESEGIQGADADEIKRGRLPGFAAEGRRLPVLNINSSHLLVPMPTMNNRGSIQLCQHSELFTGDHRRALVHSVGYSRLEVQPHSPAWTESSVCSHPQPAKMCTFRVCVRVYSHRQEVKCQCCLKHLASSTTPPRQFLWHSPLQLIRSSF